MDRRFPTVNPTEPIAYVPTGIGRQRSGFMTQKSARNDEKRLVIQNRTVHLFRPGGKTGLNQKYPDMFKRKAYEIEAQIV